MPMGLPKIGDNREPLPAMAVHDELMATIKRLDEALSRARGLAAQNRELKRSNHELHVAWQKEIDNRIHGEGLRARIRELESEAAGLRAAHAISEARNQRAAAELAAHAGTCRALKARIEKALEFAQGLHEITSRGLYGGEAKDCPACGPLVRTLLGMDE